MTVLLLALLLWLPSLASAATVCVNTTGTAGCFPTIQQGVDAAVSGDTVEVAAGVYVERVVVAKRKRLRLQGAGPTATIIDGNGAGTVLKIKGPNTNMTVSGIGIRNGERGLVFGERVTINVSDCAITDNAGGGGISGNGSGSSTTVARCTISGNSSTLTGGGIRIVPKFRSWTRVKVVSSTIRGNAAAIRGGGIYVEGTLALIDSSVDDNSAEAGGGVAAEDLRVETSTISGNASLNGSGGGISASNATIRNSTISGNAATGGGGGVSAEHLRLEHATIANNTADLAGGGIFAGRMTLRASLVGDNFAPSGSDCSSDHARGVGVNLIEDTTSCELSTPGKSVVLNADPMLGPLQNNGGTTETQALLAGSPAIGVVTTKALCKAPDQRGEPRTVPCDLGAYEAS